jgi:hypothetical protein
LNSGLPTCKAGALPLEQIYPVHFGLVIFETGSPELFAHSGLKLGSS